jgi:hypothetical protein
MRRQSAVPDSHQRALLRRLQLPSHFCLHVSRPACHPRGLQQARPIHGCLLQCNLERFTLSVHSHRSPFSPGPQIAVKFRAPVDSLLPPPLRHLRRIDERIEYALGRRRNPHFALNRIRAKCHPRCCHFFFSFLFPFSFLPARLLFRMLSFYKCLQAIQVCLPETPVAAQPRIDGLQRHGIQLVDALSSLAPLLHQLRASQHSQMFRYRRPRHGKGSRNLPRWQASLP